MNYFSLMKKHIHFSGEPKIRYYQIQITPNATSKSFAPIEFSTLASNGATNGSALQVDIDIFQTLFHQPAQVGSVVVHGVDFSNIGQQSNLNGASIRISVGMSAGLPFANPFQRGEIINGTILQAFGNWQGTQVALNLLVLPSTINPDEDANLSFNWIKGTPLQQAIQTTLSIAYPTLKLFGTISPNLVFTETQPAQYFNLKTFCQYINDVSKQIINQSDYLGACLSFQPGGFYIFDGTVPSIKTINVDFVDIIGNLTWLDVATIQAKLVMRADCNIGDNIVFPKGSPTTNTATNFSQSRNLISFDGVFQINKIRHVGSSRQPDANAWVTIVDCVIPGVLE
jgi:hypothetical protein